MNVSRIRAKQLFAITLILMVSITFSLNAVSANNVSSKDKTSAKKESLSGEVAEKYITAVEENETYKELFASQKLLRKDAGGNLAKAQKVSLSANDTFDNNIVIVESKVDNQKEHIGIVGLVDKDTLEVYSVSTVTKAENFFGNLVVTEYDGKSGDIILQNMLNEKGEVVETNSPSSDIDKDSYWWKVICNLSTSGSCSLGCLSLIAVPGGYPACTLLCSAFAGGAAC